MLTPNAKAYPGSAPLTGKLAGIPGINGDLPASAQRYFLPALTDNTNANLINGCLARALPARTA